MKLKCGELAGTGLLPPYFCEGYQGKSGKGHSSNAKDASTCVACTSVKSNEDIEQLAGASRPIEVGLAAQQ